MIAMAKVELKSKLMGDQFELGDDVEMVGEVSPW